jgi:hypothetical protein
MNLRLELGVGVGTNFAVQVDFFMLRGSPFHGRRSFGGTLKPDAESVSQIMEQGNT